MLTYHNLLAAFTLSLTELSVKFSPVLLGFLGVCLGVFRQLHVIITACWLSRTPLSQLNHNLRQIMEFCLNQYFVQIVEQHLLPGQKTHTIWICSLKNLTRQGKETDTNKENMHCAWCTAFLNCFQVHVFGVWEGSMHSSHGHFVHSISFVADLQMTMFQSKEGFQMSTTAFFSFPLLPQKNELDSSTGNRRLVVCYEWEDVRQHREANECFQIRGWNLFSFKGRISLSVLKRAKLSTGVIHETWYWLGQQQLVKDFFCSTFNLCQGTQIRRKLTMDLLSFCCKPSMIAT